MDNEQRGNPEPSTSALLPALVLFGGFALVLVLVLSNSGMVKTGTEAAALLATYAPTAAPMPTATTAPVVVAAAPAFDPQVVAAGEAQFHGICAACHGMNAQGIPGVGKDLVHSEFVQSLTDDELVAFIIQGRPATDPANTTGIPMPPRGGSPMLTDDQLRDIVVYLRSLAAEAGVTTAQAAAPAPAEAVAAPAESTAQAEPLIAAALLGFGQEVTEAPEPLVAAALLGFEGEATESAEAAEAPAAEAVGEFSEGEAVYVWNCSTCHGADGQGAAPYGPGLAGSDLLAQGSEAELVAFLTEAHPPADPAAGFPHPIRGGYPELTDEQITALVDYLHMLLEP